MYGIFIFCPCSFGYEKRANYIRCGFRAHSAFCPDRHGKGSGFSAVPRENVWAGFQSWAVGAYHLPLTAVGNYLRSAFTFP